jgi:hypothetical protein
LRKGEPWPSEIEVVEVRSLRQALQAALVEDVRSKDSKTPRDPQPGID